MCPTHQEAVTGRSLDFRARLWGGGVKQLGGSARPYQVRRDCGDGEKAGHTKSKRGDDVLRRDGV